MPPSLKKFLHQDKTQNHLSSTTSFHLPSYRTSGTNASSITEKMTGKTPLEIGTRGTAGSLIMQEIEYFSRLEINCKKKPRCQLPETACTSSCSRPKLGSLITTPKKKKKGSSRLIPSMCSMVDVVKRNQPNLSSGFSYRTLKADVKTLQV